MAPRADYCLRDALVGGAFLIGRPSPTSKRGSLEEALRPRRPFQRHQVRGKMFADIAPVAAPVPLVAAFALDRLAEDGAARVIGAAAMALLSSNSMKMAYVTALGTTAAHLDIAARLAAAVALVRLGCGGTPASAGTRIEAYLDAAALLPRGSEQGN